MGIRRLLFAILVGITSFASLAEDTLIYNAVVHTVDPSNPKAEALVVDSHGVILAVGDTDTLWGAYPNAKSIDLDGQMVLPGFHDVHLHAIEAGITAEFCDFSQFGDEKAFSAELQQCNLDWDGEAWVLGAGVNMTNLLDQVENPLALIDELIPSKPAIIIDDIGHGAWANTQALKKAGLLKLADNPDGGMLIRFANGQLTGVVLESLSQTLIDAAFPDTSENREWALESLQSAMQTLAENGITSISDAGGYWPRGHHKVWQMAEQRGLMTVRASNALYVYPDKNVETQIEQLVALKVVDKNKLARMDQVKIYVDGVLTQGTGLLSKPYEKVRQLPEATPNGFEYFPNNKLNTYTKRLSDAGFQLHLHATGNLGTKHGLDAIEQANADAGPHRFTHLYLVDPQDIKRFKELNVVADFQLAPSSVDPKYEAFISKFIGDSAYKLLAIKMMINRDVLVTLSSDWDADELNPLVKLKTVLTRKRQAVPDLETAIELMTINPARLLRHDDRTGSISVGKFADMVVIDKDLFKLKPSQIPKANIVATLLQGEAVYDPEGWFGK